ncbi:MAG: hypothetical protein R3214_09895 [Christiangramia sp.]|nr:hypothetical protein [Christiangramia sp.]
MLTEDINDSVLKMLFFIHGFSTILLVMAAFFYCNYKANKLSSLFFISILILALSDLTMFSAYYVSFMEFYYLERILYVIGLGCLVNFSWKYSRTKKRAAEAETDIPEV